MLTQGSALDVLCLFAALFITHMHNPSCAIKCNKPGAAAALQLLALQLWCEHGATMESAQVATLSAS
jgi:hypothetical protein